MLQRTIEDRLAIFGLADLEEGLLALALDEIAFGIEAVERQRPATDPPAEQHRDACVHRCALQRLAQADPRLRHRLADELGDAEHARHVGDAARRVALIAGA